MPANYQPRKEFPDQKIKLVSTYDTVVLELIPLQLRLYCCLHDSREIDLSERLHSACCNGLETLPRGPDGAVDIGVTVRG